MGIETIIGDPVDGRVENIAIRYGFVDTKASVGLVLALLEDMQHRGEVLKPNLLVCAVEEIGCSGAPLFAQRARAQPRSTGGGRSDDVRTNLHHKGAAVLLRACKS